MEQYQNKKVRLVLMNGFHYSGLVLSVNGDFIILLDKYKKEVTINKNSIQAIEEAEKNESN